MSRGTRTALRSTAAFAVAALGFTLVNALPAHAISSTGGSISRSEVLSRAQSWVDEGVPYDQSSYKSDANGSYREDCSGFVSMAWHLSSSLVTSTLPSVSTQISFSQLQGGDILDYTADHTFLFNKWTNQANGDFTYYAESNPNDPTHGPTAANVNNSTMEGWPTSNYGAYRYNNITADLSLNYSETTAGDYNGDKISDLFAKDASGNLSVWTGNSGGSFSSRHQLTGGWNVTQTTAADFTSHGLADLIGSDSSGNLYLWTANSGGVYSAPKLVTTGWNFTQMVSGDFRGTGHQDLVAKDSSNNLYLWAGNGDGTFGSKVLLTSGWNYTQTTAADFTGDGVADLVAKDSSNNLYLWTGNKGGTFSAPKLVTTGWNFTQTVAGNFAGTGHADLIARDDTTGTLYRWAGNGNGTFNSKVTVTSGW